MLTAAQSSLTTLIHSSKEKHSWENIWRRNVYMNTTNSSPWNISWNHFQFESNFQKLYRSIQQFLEELFKNYLVRIIKFCTKSLLYALFWHVPRFLFRVHGKELLRSRTLPTIPVSKYIQHLEPEDQERLRQNVGDKAEKDNLPTDSELLARIGKPPPPPAPSKKKDGKTPGM